jgi:hypothetical protein
LPSRRAANNIPGIRRSGMLRHAWKVTTMKGRFADSSCRSAYLLSHVASDSLDCRLAASSARDTSAVRTAPRLGRMPHGLALTLRDPNWYWRLTDRIVVWTAAFVGRTGTSREVQIEPALELGKVNSETPERSHGPWIPCP